MNNLSLLNTLMRCFYKENSPYFRPLILRYLSYPSNQNFILHVFLQFKNIETFLTKEESIKFAMNVVFTIT